MAGVAYVNGRYVRLNRAAVSIEDRGYQFADGVYEVCLAIGGRFWDFEGHLARMERSLGELSMPHPMPLTSLRVVMVELLRRNRLTDALVYIQATRGAAPRNHAFPPEGTPPALVMTARRFDLDQSDAQARRGVGVITQPDIRWGRVDIKTISLLPNTLAKQAAAEAGCVEAWLIRDGKITEGAASNAWIVDAEGVLITHPKGREILGGITRETAIECARDLQIPVREEAFTLDDAKAASEAFISSATNLIMPVVSIDGEAVGGGTPGPVAARLRGAYKDRARNG